jgi:hypothetical protein
MQNFNSDETMPVRPDREPEETPAEQAETQEIKRPMERDESASSEVQYQSILHLDDEEPPHEADGEPEQPPKRRRWLRWVFIGIIVFILIVGLGGVGGYLQAQGAINAERTQQAAVEAVIQFRMGEDDLNALRCGIAMQRFQYVARVNPEYPGLQEKLVAAQICSGGTATPTVALAPTVTPTLDNRQGEELFAEAQALLQAEDWNTLLDTLDSLRKNEPAYKAVEVDGMYYIALRNRGVDRVLVQGDLEGGIFDLNRAEQYGPLDAEASSYRNWASWHITGLSFWEIDWGQAVYYFNQVAVAAPNLWDGSYYAQDRLATAQVGYAGELIDQADNLLLHKEWCQADDLFTESENYAPINATAQPTATYASQKCDLSLDEGGEE